MELYGLCYNCGKEGHISRKCTNKTVCVCCGGEGHIARGCRQPRSSSSLGGSPRAAPSVRQRLTPPAPDHWPPLPPGGSLPPPPPGPPPPGAVRIERPWNVVVSDVSSAGSVDGSTFDIPFAGLPPRVEVVRLPPAQPAGVPECCYLESSEEIVRLEAELSRAVLVMVTGTRPQVDLASAAATLHAAFGIGHAAMSIRAYHPEDFLVLYDSMLPRQRMVDRGFVDGPWFKLSLRPWIRQAQATAANLPFLVPLDLFGVPAQVWTR